MKTYPLPIYNPLDNTWLVNTSYGFLTLTNDQYKEYVSVNHQLFKQNLDDIYRELLKDQEPLGEDFEKIWNDNIDNLYEE